MRNGCSNPEKSVRKDGLSLSGKIGGFLDAKTIFNMHKMYIFVALCSAPHPSNIFLSI